MIEAFVAVGALVVVLGGFSLRQRLERRSELTTFAAAGGWSYAHRDDGYCVRWGGRPFGRGGARAARNVMAGSHRGRNVTVFDYEYQEAGPDTSGTTRHFTVYAVELPVALPPVQISPATFLARVARAAGRNDIRLPCESFNDMYRVKTQDPRLAYALLTETNTDLLLTQEALQLRTDGTTLLGVDLERLAVERILERLDLMCEFLDNVPEFVWSDRRSGTTGR